MSLTRRDFLVGSAALTAAGAAAAALEPQSAAAAPPKVCSTQYYPPLATIVFNRTAYGPRPDDIAAFQALGADDSARLNAYIEQQLNPNFADDAEVLARLDPASPRATHMKVFSSTGGTVEINAVRPLQTLGASVAQLWGYKTNPSLPWSERRRPYNEVRIATWIRAVYSKWQLFEVLTDFWHNHFNVKADAATEIAATLPAYDQLIRGHALGNFRQFVEAVGRSPAMMYYLDNVSNRAGGGEGGNENYARELFELHTLGSDNYYKFYDSRTKIAVVTYGGASFAAGYIDEDVYEAARCLTGWTIDETSGAFTYRYNWHDPYDKTVLAIPPLPGIEPAPNVRSGSNESYVERDGRAVYDLVANHIGTARYICTKLCRRFIADDPPAAVVEAAVQTWMANRDQPDQIKRVLRTILLSNAFRSTFGAKVKRPLEFIWSYFRATGANLPSDVAEVNGNVNEGGYWSNMFWLVDQTGQRLFGWDTPTGHPDLAVYWSNTNSMLRSWNSIYQLTQSWGGNVAIDIVGQTDRNASCEAILQMWVNRMVGFSLSTTSATALLNFLTQGNDSKAPPQPRRDAKGNLTAPDWDDPQAIPDRLRALVQLIAMTPEFGLR